MKETIQLWVRMHSYKPPATSPNPRPYYAAGDTLLGIGLGVLSTIAAAFMRRRK
jgi:hypothetical protein